MTNGISAGVGGGNFGVERARPRGSRWRSSSSERSAASCWVPPPCSGVFPDVPCASPFAPWIEALADGRHHERLRQRELLSPEPRPARPDGGLPPQGRRSRTSFRIRASGPSPTSPVRRRSRPGSKPSRRGGITGGCGGNIYCPLNPVTRGQMAVLVWKTFFTLSEEVTVRAAVLVLILASAGGGRRGRDVHRHEHRRLRRRLAPPGDPGRQRRRRRRHDRVRHRRSGRAHDRARIALPTVTDVVTIDGYTQPGSSPNTAAARAGNNAVLNVEISGAAVALEPCLTWAAAGGRIQGLTHEPLPDRDDPRHRLGHDHRQLPRHHAAGRAAHRRLAAESRRSTRSERQIGAADDRRRRGRTEPGGPQPHLGTHVSSVLGGRPRTVLHAPHHPGKPHRRRRDRVLHDLQRRRRLLGRHPPAPVVGGPGAQRGQRHRRKSVGRISSAAPRSSRATSSGRTATETADLGNLGGGFVGSVTGGTARSRRAGTAAKATSSRGTAEAGPAATRQACSSPGAT